jgi:protein phosphatase-4 regulatory subunit 3
MQLVQLDSATGGMQRVKVYRLNTEGMWDDKGTGSVSVEYMEVNLALQ